MVRDVDKSGSASAPTLQEALDHVLPAGQNRRATDRSGPILEVLSAEELAQRLGCEPEHINALAASHALPAVKIGRSWRFPAPAITTFLNLRAMDHLTTAAVNAPIEAADRPRPGRRSRPADLRRTVKLA